jgi:4-hydroxybenzoyl-CoA thioesterase/acyl-CoA thioester hydrolase
MFPFETTRRVEFCDTDAAGIMHFAAYFRYMEQAEHALWRALGLSVVTEYEGGTIGWPRVSADCSFHRPVRFEDELTIGVAVRRLGEKSVAFRFRFTHDEQEVATGSIVAACCAIEPGEPPRAIDIPPRIAQKLAAYVIT